MYNHSQLTQMLKTNVCVVTFEKVDGSTRKMMCTLIPELLPEDYRISSGSLLTEGDGNQERLSVFDVNLNEWRSFRINSVKDVQVVSKLI